MGLTVYGGGGKPEEEKTVTAGTSAIEVSPSSGKVMKKVTVNPTPTESKSVTPTTSELTVTPSEGKHLSQVIVGAVEDVTPEVNAQTPVITQILEGLVGKAQGANATADKILEGYSAYVGQELLEGTAKDASTMVDLLALFGCTQLAFDKFTYASRTSMKLAGEISHSLGVSPEFAIMIANTKTLSTADDLYLAVLTSSTGTAFIKGTKPIYAYAGNYNVTTCSDTQIKTDLSTEYFAAGVEYTLITMA